MEVKEKIQKLIKENSICLFMKGTPSEPQCGFSMTVSNILKHLNVNFKGINVLEDERLREYYWFSPTKYHPSQARLD